MCMKIDKKEKSGLKLNPGIYIYNTIHTIQYILVHGASGSFSTNLDRPE